MANDPSDKWAGEKKALKKVQMHFNFVRSLHRQIHHVAADTDLAPSDVVRKIVGLSYAKVQRPRIGLSFNEQDLVYLAERYAMDVDDRGEIKNKVMEEIAKHFDDE
jgi:hypothetical protein